jgi:hypothetical protein
MNSEDPVADVHPEQTPQPTVSSPSGYLGYTLLIILLLAYSRAGWYATETIFLDKFPVIKPYTNFFLVVWFFPILGLLASVVIPSAGGIFGWMVTTAIFASVPLIGSFFYIILFGLPPESQEYVYGLFSRE